MSSENITGTGKLDRRDFLKKAGATAGLAAVAYTVPQIMSAGPKPAYASVTGPEQPPQTVGCYTVTATKVDPQNQDDESQIDFEICTQDCDHDVSNIQFTDPNGVGSSGSFARGVDDDFASPFEDNHGGDWVAVEDSGFSKFEEAPEPSDQVLGGADVCVTFHVGYDVDVPLGTQITLKIKAGQDETEVIATVV